MNCKHCGKEIVSWRAVTFCSHPCVVAAMRAVGKTAICQACGKAFHCPPSRKYVYCTVGCRRAGSQARRTKPCARCGETFLAHRGRGDDQKYCSVSCGSLRGIRSQTLPSPVAGATWIPLAGERFALVDDADAEVVQRHHWYVNSKGYAATLIDKKIVRMHRFLVGSWIDHKNLDRLDNRRSNLRHADARGNVVNRGVQRNNTSGFKGVSRYGDKWGARLGAGRRRIWLGLFDTPEEAAACYDRAAVATHGEWARPNATREVV